MLVYRIRWVFGTNWDRPVLDSEVDMCGFEGNMWGYVLRGLVSTKNIWIETRTRFRLGVGMG
jgi:hypothetical protein